ncbi:hypothetical protein BDZ90DRAFT_262631 [Jaminaea rosea]|uniref:Uncharacterized protein n=1 Tax=Jaminaea rosea TaxID=1569628 RepID=A0A316UJS4_9BASI|nr:hypothetical protein BDZ90DRAFT_262631 [Jaminaea rosea]PWN25184.1 hypothetical protein BDZ90DRAFT_262631 [Jaminaea rosea]
MSRAAPLKFEYSFGLEAAFDPAEQELERERVVQQEVEPISLSYRSSFERSPMLVEVQGVALFPRKQMRRDEVEAIIAEEGGDWDLHEKQSGTSISTADSDEIAAIEADQQLAEVDNALLDLERYIEIATANRSANANAFQASAPGAGLARRAAIKRASGSPTRSSFSDPASPSSSTENVSSTVQLGSPLSTSSSSNSSSPAVDATTASSAHSTVSLPLTLQAERRLVIGQVYHPDSKAQSPCTLERKPAIVRYGPRHPSVRPHRPLPEPPSTMTAGPMASQFGFAPGEKEKKVVPPRVRMMESPTFPTHDEGSSEPLPVPVSKDIRLSAITRFWNGKADTTDIKAQVAPISRKTKGPRALPVSWSVPMPQIPPRSSSIAGSLVKPLLPFARATAKGRRVVSAPASYRSKSSSPSSSRRAVTSLPSLASLPETEVLEVLEVDEACLTRKHKIRKQQQRRNHRRALFAAQREEKDKEKVALLAPSSSAATPRAILMHPASGITSHCCPVLTDLPTANSSAPLLSPPFPSAEEDADSPLLLRRPAKTAVITWQSFFARLREKKPYLVGYAGCALVALTLLGLAAGLIWLIVRWIEETQQQAALAELD